MKPREMEKLLLQNGSHRIYYNPQTQCTAVVPFHAKELKKGTEAKILKDAGLK